MEDNTILFVQAFGLDDCFKAIQLGLTNTTVESTYFFLFSLESSIFAPCYCRSDKSKSFVDELGDDLPVDNLASIPPNTSHSFLGMYILRDSLQDLSDVHTFFLPFKVSEQQLRLTPL